jgi:hypothetical protein
VRHAEQPLLHRCVRDDGGVVLVLAERCLPLAGQDADDAKRLIVDANERTRGIGPGAKQLIARNGAKDDDLRGGPNVFWRQKRSVLERPRSHVNQLVARTLDLRVPVRVFRNDLRARVQAG